jgi:hypothetical protein
MGAKLISGRATPVDGFRKMLNPSYMLRAQPSLRAKPGWSKGYSPQCTWRHPLPRRPNPNDVQTARASR